MSCAAAAVIEHVQRVLLMMEAWFVDVIATSPMDGRARDGDVTAGTPAMKMCVKERKLPRQNCAVRAVQRALPLSAGGSRLLRSADRTPKPLRAIVAAILVWVTVTAEMRNF